jgi:streptogrisin C
MSEGESMRSTKLSLGVGLAILVLGATATPALAVEPRATVQSFAEAEAMDLALVAKARGWTVAQARADRDAAERLGKVQEAVAARMPNAFVGGVLSSTPGGAPTLLLKGEANDFVRATVAAAGIPIRIADRQPYSLAELTERSTQVQKQLAAMGYRDIGTAVDVAKGQVLASVTARAGLPTSRSALSAALPSELLAGTQLTVVDKPVGALSAAFGGMVNFDTTGGWCTSGWPVRHNATGTIGVTTAGHCFGIDTIVDPAPNPDVNHSFPFQLEHQGTWGDIEWHTSTTAMPDDFYATTTEIRDVAAVEPQASITVGEAVCVFGRSSNVRGCDTTVTFPVSSCTLNGITYGQLTAMSGPGTIAAGDSGGGWSFNFTAYGSTTGWCNFGDNIGRAVWSAADRYDEAIGVSVRTA